MCVLAYPSASDNELTDCCSILPQDTTKVIDLPVLFLFVVSPHGITILHVHYTVQ